MSKSYSKFNYEDLATLGLEVIEDTVEIYQTIPPIAPSAYLLTTLERNMRRKLHSEKAKSEFIIAPILTELEELNYGKFAVYSGYKFNVNPKLGLHGFCDFVLSLNPKAVVIEVPVFCVVESKNEDIQAGVPQCIAEMYAAQLFNARKGKIMPVIYGAVTFGMEWKFIALVEQKVVIDRSVFYLNQLPQILGVLQYIVTQTSKNT
jgi:hypothetical protein